MRKKRDLFDELVEGFDALADQRAGKRLSILGRCNDRNQYGQR